MPAPVEESPTGPLDSHGRVQTDLACLKCGYNLRTLAIDGLCPECGHAVAEATAGYLPQLDRDGRIAVDLPCVSCGCNLRTQPVTGICPECATPVAASAHGHHLQLASARWVRRMANGALLLLIVVIASLALPFIYIGLFGLGAVLYSVTGPSSATGPSEAALLVILALIIAAAIVCLWLLVRGVLNLTAPDPAAKSRPEGLTGRRVARYGLLAVPVLLLATLGVQLVPMWLPFAAYRVAVVVPAMVAGWLVLPLAVVVPAMVAGVGWLVLPLAVLRHIATLMRRIPRPGLVTFAKIEFWAVLITTVLYLGGYGFFIFDTLRMVTTATLPATVPGMTAPPTFGPLFSLALISAMVGGCGSLGTFIAGIVLLILVWRALANAARLAEVHAAPE